MATKRAEEEWQRLRESAGRLIKDVAARPEYQRWGGQARLAEALGVKPSSMSTLLSGRNLPDAETIVALAHLVGDEAAALFSEILPTSTHDDARRWFLHRVAHSNPNRLDDARRWLAESPPPYSGAPVPWNNELYDAFDAWWAAKDRGGQVIEFARPAAPDAHETRVAARLDPDGGSAQQQLQPTGKRTITAAKAHPELNRGKRRSREP
jgi:transcriptional regulator with XRE-family HTH domain